MSLFADGSDCPTIGPDGECCRCIGQALLSAPAPLFRVYINISPEEFLFVTARVRTLQLGVILRMEAKVTFFCTKVNV